MDRKTIIALVIGILLMVLWPMAVNKIFPPIPRPVVTNQVATAAPPGGSNVINGAAPNTAAPVISATPTNAPAAVVPPGTPEEKVIFETSDVLYTFTSHGGGIREVTLKRFSESVRRGGAISSNLVTINEHGRSPILSMQADGAFGDNVFKLTKTETNVVAEKTLPSGLRVVKTFEPGSNYTMRVRVWLQNTAGQPLGVPAQVVNVGSAAPTGPEEQPTFTGLFWYNGEKAQHVESGWFDNRVMGCFMSRPRSEYDSGVNPIQWAAAHNQFFALAVIPATNALPNQFKAWRAPLPQGADKKQAGHVFDASIYYPAVTIAPTNFVERDFRIYSGPKQEKTLSQLGRHVDEVMDFGFWSPISKIFLRAMNFLHRFMPYGVAIIVITIIIKLIFWPLTQASTRSMKRMQALQPEIKKLQEKYKDDPAKQQKKMMEMWREHKVNPMSGCWPMMIQLPIFFALFRMIPNAIELRGTPFLWIADLSRPDTIFYIPGVDFPFNPLPLVMGATMLWQARLAPPSPGMDPAQQNMMKYMPLIFLVFLYNQPSGLTLYWTVQNVLTIVQTKLTKAKEEKAAVPVPTAPKKK